MDNRQAGTRVLSEALRRAPNPHPGRNSSPNFGSTPGDCHFVFPSPTGNRDQHMLDHCKAVAKRRPRSREVRSKDLSLHLRHLYASVVLRCSHGATLDGTQVARNDYAVSGAGDRRPRQVGLGEDSFVVKEEPGAAEGSGARDGNTSKGNGHAWRLDHHRSGPSSFENVPQRTARVEEREAHEHCAGLILGVERGAFIGCCFSLRRAA